MKFGNKDYALVPDRLKKFREENPKASITTDPTYTPDGSLIFKATIIKDLSDEYSARGTGNAMYSVDELKKPKSFEKLETVSIGRALANVGYLNDGQVATTEELDEFYEIKRDEYGSEIDKAKSVDDLMKIFRKMNSSNRKEFTETLGLKRKEIENAASIH